MKLQLQRKTRGLLTGGGAGIRRSVVVGGVGGGRLGWAGTGGGGGGVGGLALTIVVTLRSLSCSTWIVSSIVASSSLWRNMCKNSCSEHETCDIVKSFPS